MHGKKIRSWIVVADSAKARIYSNTGPKLDLALVSEIDSDGARRSSQELVTDKPGRTFSSASPRRSGMEPPSDPQDVEKHKFVKHLVSILDTAALGDEFDDVYLVAAPRTLGEIRKLANGHITDKVRGELAKDLTNIPEHDLPKHLEDLDIGKPVLA
ncbi:host attachment protein [Iodidimonas sp. SYSU 1G8]|uniref:host attachment protein n=1 Tax=Iodidimonas sp. SYSU 1G8 TaxID=3133967 RepID=UPI0031FEDC31